MRDDDDGYAGQWIALRYRHDDEHGADGHLHAWQADASTGAWTCRVCGITAAPEHGPALVVT